MVASVAGTIIESRYNAEVANLRIYSVTWFIVLLFLLWINIFCAAVSRIPFKKHQIGFVITHIGMLLLLIGSIMTKLFGIDGSIQIQEKSQSNYVSLPELVYEIGENGQPGYSKVFFPKSLEPLGKGELDFLNNSKHPLFVINYVPFVEPNRAATPSLSGAGALNFKLESQFFNVDESLHLTEKPDMRMGPALIRYVKNKSVIKNTKTPKKLKQKEIKGPRINIYDVASNTLLKSVPLNKLLKTALKIKEATVKVVKIFEQAVVVGNKLDEGGQKGVNPALELSFVFNGKTLRDVVYAKFPTFSMLTKENLPIRIEYKHPKITDTKSLDAHGASSGEMAQTLPDGNVIEFVQNKNNSTQVEIVLFKNKKEVLSKIVSIGESVETPWMGMKITLLSLGAKEQHNHDHNEVKIIPLPLKAKLPPSALKVATMDGTSTWIIENQSKSIRLNGQELPIYFGRNSINLPFSIYLEKFYKKDYPGSTTPMSYESDIKRNGQGETIKIAMNEPYKYGGYTFYQSSYILQEGRPPVTVLSVNKDPGRWVKYIGSLILCLGIMIFTLMRSRIYKR
ncbi:MAG: hypothetical protein HN576_09550 [Bacteriovoracaceae bacterium]|nr:hypothetical protein [Bacteriovoracaceae bacterium]